jgi:hypothetical protein
MFKKPPNEPRNVERNELVNHPALEALFSKPTRGDSPCCDKHAESSRPDPLDERQNAGEFADTCAMQPDEWTFRPRDAAFAAALGQALTVFLAALESSRQKDGSKRTSRGRQQPIHPQASRQFTTQDA